MGLKPKTAVLQIRLDEDLLSRFRSFAEAHNSTVSDAVRHFMVRNVEQHEAQVERDRLKAVRAAQITGQGGGTDHPSKTPPKPVKRPKKGGR